MAQEPIKDITPNRWWRKPLFALLALVALGFVALKVYRRVEPDRLAKRARAYMEQGDYMNATLTLRRAIEINPTNRAAMRLMAEMAERLQSPAALEWRRVLAELNPGSAPDALAWANSALRLGRTPVAKLALEGVAEKDRGTAAYHAAAGGLAISEGRWKEAEKEYGEAVRFAPQDDLHRYNFATIQLQSPDAATRASALKALAELTKSERVQLYARRAIVTRLVGEKKWDEALAHSTEMQQSPAASLNDRLTHLDLLQGLKKPELAEALAAMQKKALANPMDAAATINWMRMNGRANEIAPWVATFDAKLAGEPPVLAARAEALVEAKDWAALEQLVATGDWRGDEYRRLAFYSRALRETGNRESAKVQWDKAISAANTQGIATQLAYLASTWGWQAEMQAVLWASAASSTPDWALRMLHGIFQGEGDTAGMLRVAKRFAEAHPKDRAARNNVALLSLLLNRDTEKAQALAAELYKEAPEDPTIVSTYAFALHSQGKSAEGRAILEKLKPEQLRTPGLAAYYAILLASSGATAEARPYFELAAKGPLLPEEKKLLAAAEKL
jgi:Flp pilus assembly protein TadD